MFEAFCDIKKSCKKFKSYRDECIRECTLNLSRNIQQDWIFNPRQIEYSIKVPSHLKVPSGARWNSSGEFIDSEFFPCSFCFSFNSLHDKLKIDSLPYGCDNKWFYSRGPPVWSIGSDRRRKGLFNPRLYVLFANRWYSLLILI